jgi:hypothetical protein
VPLDVFTTHRNRLKTPHENGTSCSLKTSLQSPEPEREAKTTIEILTKKPHPICQSLGSDGGFAVVGFRSAILICSSRAVFLLFDT